MTSIFQFKSVFTRIIQIIYLRIYEWISLPKATPSNDFDFCFLYKTSWFWECKCYDIQMNSFGQQNDFLVQIFFFVVSYTTDHRICFLRVRNCHKLIETYCFVRCVLQSIERQAWSSLSSKERSSLVVNAKKTTNIFSAEEWIFSSNIV